MSILMESDLSSNSISVLNVMSSMSATRGTGERSPAALPDSDEEDAWTGTETRLEDNVVATRPSRQVALSDDLLPLIFTNLRELLTLEKGILSWKAGYTPLLLVNRDFFHASADIIWEELDSLAPVFELLPWYKIPYTGIGTHDYVGASDWKRFSLYAHRIQRLELRQPVDIGPTPCFMELFTLPGRPNPLLPALKSVSLLPAALLGMPSLFLLVSPALTTMEVSCTLSECYRAPLQLPPSENVLNALTMIPFHARQLHTFAYTGVANNEFFHRLSKFITLRTLRLTFIGPMYLGVAEKLCALEHLEHLEVTVPSIVGRFVDKKAVAKPLLVSSRLGVLKTLNVAASAYGQCILAHGIPARQTCHCGWDFLQ